MRRKTLTILTLIGLGLFIVGFGTVVVMTTATVLYCSSPSCSSPGILSSIPLTGLIVGSTIGEVLILAASVLQIIAWIGALIKQAKQQQWAWFVCTFLFSSICLWIYLLVVPETQEPVYMQPESPVYQPYTQGYRVPQPVHERSENYQEGGHQYQYVEQQQHQQQYEDPIIKYSQD